MATINFKGKEIVRNHHLTIPYHELVPDAKKGLSNSSTKLGAGEPSLSDNLIIHGDNLLALKALLPTYAGKVDCIYIDPPYNRGNENWAYNDNVNSPMMKEWLGKVVDKDDLTRHDKWLCMMMPRLKIMRELLREEGVILISIDDNELNNLKILLDEIFYENFISTLCVVTNPGGRDYGGIALTHEYILVYKKSETGVLNEIDKGEDYEFPYKDKLGGFELRELRNRNVRFNKENRPNLFYPFFVDPNSKDENNLFRISLEKTVDYSKEVLPRKSQGIQTVWRWGKEKAKENLNVNLAAKLKNDGEYQIVEKYRKETKMIKSFLNDKEFVTERGTEILKEIFSGKSLFDYPKSVALIKVLLSISSNPNAVILDSFAGSGTTAHAVLALNKSDKGTRKFILIQLPEIIEKDRPAYKLGFREVVDITAERVRRVIKGVKSAKDDNLKKGLGGSFSYFELGKPIDTERILKGKDLPTFGEMARYIFYTATGEEFNEKKINEKTGFIGESKEYQVYLFYKPDMEYLKSTALTLERAETLGKFTGKKRLVFAPAKYLDQEHLERHHIDFAQLPFEIYQKAQ